MGTFPKDQALQGAWREEYRRRDEIREGKRKEYVSRLIASLPAKEPEARVISMNTLLDSSRRDGSDAPWLPALAASIVADFRSLPSNMRINLLLSRWNIIGSAAMLPLLREIYANPLEQQAAGDIAVRRIVSFRQGCVKGDIGAGIRIIGAGMDGPCASCTWRGWSPCRLRRRNRTCG
jgi:hypothetical protein